MKKRHKEAWYVTCAFSFLNNRGVLKLKNEHDWRKSPKGRFPYTGTIDNKKYLKDRAELFAESGNGWWWWQGTHLGKNIGKDNE